MTTVQTPTTDDVLSRTELPPPSSSLKPVVDPFSNTSVTDLPCWWRGIMSIVGLTLFPLRFVLIVFVLIPLTLLFLIPFSSCFDKMCSSSTRKERKNRRGSQSLASSMAASSTAEIESSKKDDDVENQTKETKEMEEVTKAEEDQEEEEEEEEDQEEEEEEEESPHGCCRSCAVYPIRLMSRLTLWCLGFLWITIERLPGSSNTSKDRPVVVANHTSLVDAMVMAWFIAPMSVSNAGVQKIPVAGSIAKALQTIYGKFYIFQVFPKFPHTHTHKMLLFVVCGW